MSVNEALLSTTRRADQQRCSDMHKDNRRARRQPIRYTAWISLDEQLHGCVLADVSDTGARLNIDHAETLPDRFQLLLSRREGSPRRYCHVVWRKPDQVGVDFEHQLVASDEPPPAFRTQKKTEPAESA